jgi:glucosylceramidase
MTHNGIGEWRKLYSPLNFLILSPANPGYENRGSENQDQGDKSMLKINRVCIFTVSAVLLATASTDLSLAQSVSVWMTTDNQRTKLQQQSSISFSTGSSASTPTVFVDETGGYQSIEGFGASFTDSAAYLLNERVPASQLNSVMTSLFDHTSGIGVSFVRNPMGASDLARSDYSYDDMPAGQTDPSLTNFSIAHDLVDIVPLVKLARQINPQLKIMATPWSPPGWMKTSGSMIGGFLLSADTTPFANYFVKYIQAYGAQGISIDYISMQNEPLFLPSNYPGMCMPATVSDTTCGTSPTDETTAIRNELSSLAGAGLTTKILIYDHNWDRPDYPETVLSDSQISGSSQIAGIAWHGYGGTPGAMTALHDAFPALGNYETEHSGGTWVSDQVKADFEEITQVMRNWGKSYVKWSLALDQNHGPHTGGCGTCNPLVTVDSSSGAVTYDIDYYTLGQYSKFVLPGAVRVYSSNAPGFVSVAFKNPDGSKVLVVYNESRGPQAFQAVWGNQAFTYSLPTLSGATFVWSGSQNGGYTVSATSQIQASSYNDEFGLETETTSDNGGGYDVGFADNGEWLHYKGINFGSGVSSVNLRTASAGNGGTLEFHLDSVTGTLLGSATIPVTGGWQTWTTVSAPISGASGVHDLYLVFKGTTNIGNVNWFRFQ